MTVLKDRARVVVLLLSLALVFGGQAAFQPPASSAVPEYAVAVSTLATASAKKSTVALAVSDTAPRKGERLWFAGKVTVGGKPSTGRKVVLERRKGANPWKTVSTVKTRSSGKFRLELRPTKSYHYRARVVSTPGTSAATSVVKTVIFSARSRNISARSAELGSRLGVATSKVATVSAAQRANVKVNGLKKVQHRNYSKGLLVKVTTSKKNRTWFVTGRIASIYRAAGGPTGRYGVPVQDAKCGLLEKGCIQRFSRGTIYSNKSKSAGTYVTGRKGEVIAAARSQVGYKYKYTNSSAQNTKFNKFMGNTKAWCSFLLSWASDASGNGALIPKSPSFTRFKSDVQKTMKTGRTPKVGALVFFNTYPPGGVITHTGLVVAVRKDTVRVIDGNTSGKLPPNHRGVLEREWPRSRALLYAYPNY